MKEPGYVLTQQGRCPLGYIQPLACWFCAYGHSTECHYPLGCLEAYKRGLCSHVTWPESEDLFSPPFPRGKEEKKKEEGA